MLLIVEFCNGVLSKNILNYLGYVICSIEIRGLHILDVDTTIYVFIIKKFIHNVPCDLPHLCCLSLIYDVFHLQIFMGTKAPKCFLPSR